MTPTPDSCSEAFGRIYATPEYSEILEIVRYFSEPESALLTLSTDAAANRLVPDVRTASVAV
jgi:hypothetical protein